MPVKLTITHDPDRITGIQQEVIGGNGASCLTTTGALLKMNPGAKVEMLPEYYQEEEADETAKITPDVDLEVGG